SLMPPKPRSTTSWCLVTLARPSSGSTRVWTRSPRPVGRCGPCSPTPGVARGSGACRLRSLFCRK
ncbi:unnamed protein product, partial [Prorocentrum cordatum]